MNVALTGDAAGWVAAISALCGLWFLILSASKAQRKETADQNNIVLAEIKSAREASEVGRAALHERIDRVVSELRESLVGKDVHEAHIKMVNTSISDLHARLNSSCLNRRGPPMGESL